MKRFYISFLIMAAAAMTACNVELDVNESDNGTYIYTINAVVPDADTKTDYDSDGHFSWSAGDQISVLFNNGETNKFFTLTTTGSGSEVSFTGSIDNDYTIGATDGSESDLKIWALFPASDNHSYTAGNNPSFYVQPEVDFSASHFSANIPMYALNTEEGSLSFSNLASTYKFIVKGIKDGVNKVEFTIYNQTTYGLSGSWPIHNDIYIDYDYAASGSEKSTLKYIGNVTNNQAVFYVSCRYWGTFQPTITIKDCAKDIIIKQYTASKALQPNNFNHVWTVSLDASEGNGGFYPPIVIDEYIDDWNDVSHTFTTSDSRIVEWKYTKDSKNLYLYYKIPKNKVVKDSGNYNWDPYIFVGLDTDNKESTGGTPAVSDFGGGYEVELLVYPWRGTAPADPTCVIGEESNGHIKVYNTTSGNFEALTEKLSVGGNLNDDYCYIEACIPLASIGSPSGSMRVNHSFGYNSIGSTQIMPEVATISAEDKTVNVGKTVSIDATTNSTAAITYTSNNTSIATVDANGVITGVAPGVTTITVNVAAVTGEYTAASTTISVYVPAIVIDGVMSDWADVTEWAGTRNNGETNNRINNWRMLADAYNIFIYLDLVSDGITESRYIYVGFDTDNSIESGSQRGNCPGCEQYVLMYPAVAGSNPLEMIHGADPRSEVNGSSDGTLTTWCNLGTPNSLLELSIPRNKVGLASAASIKVSVSYNEYDVAQQTLVLP